MNKKDIVIKKNIEKIAKYLEDTCNWFKNQGEGCWNFNLSKDLTLAVGWSYGYDMADTDIIKSTDGCAEMNGWTCGYAVNAAIKVRNDFDCVDFDFLECPFYEDGECWDNGITMRPNKTRREYRKDARWFLETFVEMTNEIKSGKLLIN